jgi:hypothetical protein
LAGPLNREPQQRFPSGSRSWNPRPSEGGEDVTSWRPRDTFAARLRLIRGELGIDISQAATRCGLPIATWSYWERKGANPRDLLDVVLRIEHALHVDRDWLMWGGPLERRDPDAEPAPCTCHCHDKS